MSLQEILIQCVVGAGQILRERFGAPQLARRKETHSSVVTEADLAAERYILDLIRRHYPTHNIIAEESGFENLGHDLTWVVDPLDGTSNFAAGIPWFGVMVAILDGPCPVMAAMYLPVAETLYLSEQNGGVRRNNQPVRVSAETDLSNTLCAYGLDSSDDAAQCRREVALLTRLVNRVRNVRATNSLIDFCFTIDGRLGACLNQGAKIWDIAPACLMLKEAGGLLTDFNGAEITLSLAAADIQKSYAVIGASVVLLPQVVQLVKSVSSP